jgi:hypothetical protein
MSPLGLCEPLPLAINSGYLFICLYRMQACLLEDICMNILNLRNLRNLWKIERAQIRVMRGLGVYLRFSACGSHRYGFGVKFFNPSITAPVVDPYPQVPGGHVTHPLMTGVGWSCPSVRSSSSHLTVHSPTAYPLPPPPLLLAPGLSITTCEYRLNSIPHLYSQ